MCSADWISGPQSHSIGGNDGLLLSSGLVHQALGTDVREFPRARTPICLDDGSFQPLLATPFGLRVR